MYPRVRKYDSGSKKRKKKQRLEALAQKQRGALHRFVVKQGCSTEGNQTLEENDGSAGDDTNDTKAITSEIYSAPANPSSVEPQASQIEVENANGVDATVDGSANAESNKDGGDNTKDAEANTSVIDSAPASPNNAEPHALGIDVQENANGLDATVDGLANKESNNDLDVPFQPNIFDPRNWDSLDQKAVDILLRKGPKRDLSIQKGPKDKFSRRFSATHYTRVLPNGEKRDREWLVYCKELDRVFCFCCKLLRKGQAKGQLPGEGFSNWSHLSTRLQEHETSAEHVTNMTTWYDMRFRFYKNQTIENLVSQMH